MRLVRTLSGGHSGHCEVDAVDTVDTVEWTLWTLWSGHCGHSGEHGHPEIGKTFQYKRVHCSVKTPSTVRTPIIDLTNPDLTV